MTSTAPASTSPAPSVPASSTTASTAASATPTTVSTSSTPTASTASTTTQIPTTSMVDAAYKQITGNDPSLDSSRDAWVAYADSQVASGLNDTQVLEGLVKDFTVANIVATTMPGTPFPSPSDPTYQDCIGVYNSFLSNGWSGDKLNQLIVDHIKNSPIWITYQKQAATWTGSADQQSTAANLVNQLLGISSTSTTPAPSSTTSSSTTPAPAAPTAPTSTSSATTHPASPVSSTTTPAPSPPASTSPQGTSQPPASSSGDAWSNPLSSLVQYFPTSAPYGTTTPAAPSSQPTTPAATTPVTSSYSNPLAMYSNPLSMYTMPPTSTTTTNSYNSMMSAYNQMAQNMITTLNTEMQSFMQNSMATTNWMEGFMGMPTNGFSFSMPTLQMPGLSASYSPSGSSAAPSGYSVPSSLQQMMSATNQNWLGLGMPSMMGF